LCLRAFKSDARVIGQSLLNHLSRFGDLADDDCEAVTRLPGELKTLKRQWDPDNFFRMNQNIPPD